MFRLSLFALFLFSGQAFAGVYIEPYVGYQKGKVTGEASITSPVVMTTNGTSDLDGIGFGGKIGLGVAGFALGVDYMHSDDKTTPSTGPTSKNKSDDVGAFIAIPLLYSLRLNGTYFFNSKVKSGTAEITGAGYKVGLGLNLFWRININYDHVAISYDKIDDPGIVYSKYKADSAFNMISLSLPLGD